MLTTGFQAVFGEFVPSKWAISQLLRVSRAVTGLQIGFTRVTGPPLWVLRGSANRVLHLMGIQPSEELTSARSPRELASLVSRSRQFGALDDTTAALVSRSILFGDRTVADVVTPRPKVHSMATTSTVNDVIEMVARSSRHRRIQWQRGTGDTGGSRGGDRRRDLRRAGLCCTGGPTDR